MHTVHWLYFGIMSSFLRSCNFRSTVLQPIFLFGVPNRTLSLLKSIVMVAATSPTRNCVSFIVVGFFGALNDFSSFSRFRSGKWPKPALWFAPAKKTGGLGSLSKRTGQWCCNSFYDAQNTFLQPSHAKAKSPNWRQRRLCSPISMIPRHSWKRMEKNDENGGW